MQHTLLQSQFCLSVRRMYCDKTKWWTVDILIPHKMAVTLVFWHQHWLVGDAAFPVNCSPKVTYPCAKLIVPCNQYFICIWQMALRSRYSCLVNRFASHPAQNNWQCWQLHSGLLVARSVSHSRTTCNCLYLKQDLMWFFNCFVFAVWIEVDERLCVCIQRRSSRDWMKPWLMITVTLLSVLTMTLRTKLQSNLRQLKLPTVSSPDGFFVRIYGFQDVQLIWMNYFD